MGDEVRIEEFSANKVRELYPLYSTDEKVMEDILNWAKKGNTEWYCSVSPKQVEWLREKGFEVTKQSSGKYGIKW